MYNPDNGEVFGLNPVGVFIWKHISKGGQSVDQILDDVKNNYENVPESSVDHLRQFFDELEKHGLIGAKV